VEVIKVVALIIMAKGMKKEVIIILKKNYLILMVLQTLQP